jgi:polyisoprenoid-binding protein YceI
MRAVALLLTVAVVVSLSGGCAPLAPVAATDAEKTVAAAAPSAAPSARAAAAPAAAAPAALPAAALPPWPQRLAAYAPLIAGDGRVYTLDAAGCVLHAYAFRGGALAALGHDHVLAAPRLEGRVYVPAKGWSALRGDLRLRLDELVVDDPALRSATGAAFATELSDAAVAQTRAHLLGGANFDAARFPDLELAIRGAVGGEPRAVVDATLVLHGVARSMLLPLRVQLDDEQLQVDGSFAFRQSDFGVAPYSAAGGLLAVEDAVAVEFHLAARRQRTAMP